MSERRPASKRPRRIDVLMIEDDAEYRRLVEGWLATSVEPRFAMTSAPRLDDSWHRIGRCDVIVLDLCLPDAAGMDTLVAARELAGDLPIVVLTGTGGDDLGRRTLLAGADAFVPKRLAGPDTLQVALRRALAAHRATSAGRERGSAPDASERPIVARRAGVAAGSCVEDFWIDARFGSRIPRAR